MYLECTNCGHIADEDDFLEGESDFSTCPECQFVDEDGDFKELVLQEGLIRCAYNAIDNFLKDKQESKELKKPRHAKIALGEYIRHYL